MINDDNMNRVIERYFQKAENNLVSVIDSCLLCYYSEFLKAKDKIKSIYYYEKGYSTYYCYLRYQEPLNCPLGIGMAIRDCYTFHWYFRPLLN
ncbi:hypothetical protein HNQ37_001148 [Lactovum miscens]|uniref:Uncharacterized protein n=1 Tax=Lactovum miscens TaxID=190387 RepID=A0A841C2R4_9LACT|nr:hypothetical protein [Lactovum miscens]